ncbi:MAG: M56 family metallopeptidase, partial [Phycisphaerae bacterium]|nr:M56 family metallopeptidase [Phycisphaerae bacterium]
MNAISAELLDFLVSQSIHLAVLFFLIWALTAVFQRHSAHLRYLLWAVVLVKCLVPPVLTIPMAVLPGQAVTESLEKIPEQASGITVSAVPQDALHDTVTPLPSPKPLVTVPVAAQASPDRAAGRSALHASQWILVVWAAGLAALLLGTCLRAVRFAVTLKRSRADIEGGLRQTIQDLAQKFRPGMSFKVYQLEGISQPFVWGIMKGVIYLPASFSGTRSDPRRCSVLLHEMAHVVRLDPFVNFLQILVQAVYWFHPVVWIANRKLRAEREKCCDEIAIARFETTPKEYGSAIVETLMHEYKSRMAVPSMAVAGPVKNLEDRIKTIMKPGKRFYSRPTFKVWMIILVLAGILTPTTVALMPRTIESIDAGNAETEQYRATFSRGFVVELLGICEYPSETKSWWRPDGMPLAMSIKTQDTSSYTPDDPGYEFVFRRTGDASFKIDSIKGAKNKSHLEVLSPKGLIAFRAHISSQYRETDITLAVPNGAWNTVHASSSLHASTSATVRGKTLILGALVSAGEDCIVSCTDELGYEDATRIIVKDSDGREHLGVALTDTGIKGLRQRTIRYEKLALADVSEVRFQMCSYVYRTLKNISLRPTSNLNKETSAPSEKQGNVPATYSGNPGKTLQSLFMASGMLCQSIQEALEANDFDTALALCEQVEMHVDQGLKLADQVEQGAMFKALATQFRVWHDVIKTRDKARALKIGEMLNEMGSNMATQIEGMAGQDSSDNQGPEPAGAQALSKDDLQQIEQLIQAYSRVPFTMDVETAERLFEFKDEQEKQLFITMAVAAGAEFDSSSQADNKIYIMAIRPAGNNRVDVSALTPFQERYMLRTVSCVRRDQGWKIGIDIQKMVDQAQQAREFGPEELMRREAQARLKMWENATGQALVTLYEDAKTQARLRVQAMQYAREKGLRIMGNTTQTQNQEQLDQILAQSPETLRAEMILQLKKQLGPADQYGKLEFRILPNAAASGRLPSQMTAAEEQRLRDLLRDNGPANASVQGQASLWLPLRSGLNLQDAVVEEYQGQQYVLVSNEPDQIMTADGSWGLVAVS